MSPVLEELENRVLLSATLSNGVLTIVGTNGADKIGVAVGLEGRDTLTVNLNETISNFRLAAVHQIVVNTLNGNDVVYAGESTDPIPGVRLTINAGSGNDFLLGSARVVKINAGTGNDTLVGGTSGDNHLWAGAGNDELIASSSHDVLHGGSGHDKFFTGGKATVLGLSAADSVRTHGTPAVETGGASVGWDANPNPINTVTPIIQAITGTPQGITPVQMLNAYGIDKLDNASEFPPSFTNTGKGQTIVLIDPYDPTLAADVAVFDQTFNLPAINLTVNYASGSIPSFFNDSDATEAALDVEWAHAIAPAANIIVEVVDSSNFPFDELFDPHAIVVAFGAAVSAGITSMPSTGGVMSMSFGFDEDDPILDPNPVFAPIFAAAPSNISFLASSGDEAGELDLPALDPHVTAVGGTTLNVDSKGNRITETTWGKETDGSGGGGGQSTFIAVPGYQKGLTIFGEPTATFRTDPDVSMDANPATGVPVYDTTGMTGWGTVGGTSLSSPMFAGIVAIANELRSVIGNKTTGTNLPIGNALNNDLYNIFKIAPTQTFFDVTTSEPGITPAYPVGPGYDLDTGMGTPIANELIPALSGVIPSTPLFQFGGAHFVQSLAEPLPSAPLDDPRAITNFFGGGNATFLPKKVDVTIGIISSDGINPNDFANVVINPLKRSGIKKQIVKGTGTATATVDGVPFTFNLAFRGSITRDRKVDYLSCTYYTVDANGNRISQGSNYIFQGTFKAED